MGLLKNGAVATFLGPGLRGVNQNKKYFKVSKLLKQEHFQNFLKKFEKNNDNCL
jgi:hypothetical protein